MPNIPVSAQGCQLDAVLPLQCNCGCLVPFGTLQAELHRLILRHSLSELLDRLSDQIQQQSLHEQYADSEQLWDGIVMHLEHATKSALMLEALKASRGESAWH